MELSTEGGRQDHPGERDPHAIGVAELERVAGDGPLPAVALAAEHRVPRALGRPARVEIRREVRARGSSDVLRGDFAHEYAPVFRRGTWRHFVRAAVHRDRRRGFDRVADRRDPPWLHRAHRARARNISRFRSWACCWSAPACAAAPGLPTVESFASTRWRQKLLGDAGPVLTMLDGCQARHEQVGRMARLCLPSLGAAHARGAACAARGSRPIRALGGRPALLGCRLLAVLVR